MKNAPTGGSGAAMLSPQPITLGAQVLSAGDVCGDPQGVGWIPSCWRVQSGAAPSRSFTEQAGRGAEGMCPCVHPGVYGVLS